MFEPIDERLIINQFFEDMRRLGIIPRDSFSPITDGKIHRFPVEGDKYGAKSGAYFIHVNEWPNWGIMDYHYGNEMHKFKLDKDLIQHDSRPLMSREEFKRKQAENERKKQAQMKLQKENEQQAILRAWNEYQMPYSLECLNQHPYLKFKHISNAEPDNQDSLITPENVAFIRFGPIDESILKVKTRLFSNDDICKIGDLMIPLVSATTGEFVSLIHIADKTQSEGKFFKPFYAGTSTKGACVELIPHSCRTQHDPTPEPLYTDLMKKYGGDLYQKRSSDLITDMIFICEGIATGFSFLEISKKKYPVLCACSCGNLIDVAKAWKERYPKVKIIIAADNDSAGINAAQKVIAQGYADSMTTPPVEGFDWNDFLNYKKGYKS